MLETPVNLQYENEKEDCIRTFLFNSGFGIMSASHSLEWRTYLNSSLTKNLQQLFRQSKRKGSQT